MMVTLDFISGLVFGIEHISGDEEDDFQYLIGIHIGIIRLTIFKF